MTSQIVSATIDEDFPVAGQDNDSQGFRDNFNIIKDGLATANSEITVLQTSTAKLDVDNDFNGTVIANAQTNRLYGTVYPITATSATVAIDLDNGEYQTITIDRNITSVTFSNWALFGETSPLAYSKVRLEFKVAAGSVGPYSVTGFISPGAINGVKTDFGGTVTSFTTTKVLEAWTADNGKTVFVKNLGEFV